VRRDLRAVGMKPWSTGRGPKLTDTDKARRLKFARAMLRKGKAYLGRIMFSDEKYFDMQTKRHVKLWGREAPPHGGSMVQKGATVFVLGFISATTRILEFVNCPTDTTTGKKKGLDSERYGKLLTKHKAVLKRHVFQQDNASPHTKLKKSGFFKRARIPVIDWPAHSPDLNVIETLWAVLADKVRRKGPVGVRELEEFVKTAWREVKVSTVRGLCEEFHTRLKVCVQEKGNLVTRTKVRAMLAKEKKAAGKKVVSKRR
jgi:transposase